MSFLEDLRQLRENHGIEDSLPLLSRRSKKELLYLRKQRMGGKKYQDSQT